MTFIEIKEEDNINEFLDIDKEFLKSDKKIIEKKFRDKSIYILHYPEKKLISYGLTGGIDNYKKSCIIVILRMAHLEVLYYH